MDLPFAHVLVIAPQLDVAKDLASRVEAAGLRVDRGSSAEDLCAALGALPPPQVILVAVDDMLERARIRRALAASRRWTAVPVVEMGHGALHPHAVAAVIATHAIVA